MTTHVFVVDKTTFKIHLEYLFAGTGAKSYSIDFNNNIDTGLRGGVENMLVSMVADSGRIRRGDQIIFYLQQSFTDKIFEGKFYGIFKAKEDWSFLDNNDSNQYLSEELEKSLTFRTLIEPYKVYPKGVTEWEALDEIKNIQSPNQMLWSLIYRKLKAHRGNTMITIYESERLCQLIRNKNNREDLEYENKLLTFDSANQIIKCVDETPMEYQGRKEEINVLPRLIAKLDQSKAFEAHLQAYIVRNIGNGINQELDDLVLDESNIEWLGNEVSCGVGMQRIDIMLSVLQDDQKILLPIELKAVEADEKNTIQIRRYIDWIEQYYIPNRQSDIQPILISKKIVNKESERYQKIIQSFEEFNFLNTNRCKKLKYIEFDIENNDLIFNDVDY